MIKPISKSLFITLPHSVVIPAKAGIHVSQGFQWPPAPRLRTSRTGFAGVTDSSHNYLYSIYALRYCSFYQPGKIFSVLIMVKILRKFPKLVFINIPKGISYFFYAGDL